MISDKLHGFLRKVTWKNPRTVIALFLIFEQTHIDKVPKIQQFKASLFEEGYTGGGSFSSMETGFKGKIQGTASGLVASLMKRENFCMWLPRSAMIGFAYDLSPLDDHCAHHRIRACSAPTLGSQGKCAFHEFLIGEDGGHRLFEEVCNFLRGTDFDLNFFFTIVCLAIVFLTVVFFLFVFFLATSLLGLVVVACVCLVDVLRDR